MGGILIKKYIKMEKNRKLTPIEYERCQCLPDNYTKYGFVNKKVIDISDTNRYNACGNGWNANVIKHIFKSLK